MKNRTKYLIAGVWLCMLFCGTILLARYETSAGSAGAMVPCPPIAKTTINPDLSHVYVFLHPQCPCSRATVEQLHQLYNSVGELMELTVFVYRPVAMEDNWVETDIWNAARKIPSAHLKIDVGAGIAKQFWVVTSGHTLIYRGAGLPLFSGGITSSRGHEGECVHSQRAQDVIRKTLSPNGAVANPYQSPVFGCPLYITNAEVAQ